MTREQLAYHIIKELNPSQEEAPMVYRRGFDDSWVMLRVYQLRRFPKMMLVQIVSDIEKSRL